MAQYEYDAPRELPVVSIDSVSASNEHRDKQLKCFVTQREYDRIVKNNDATLPSHKSLSVYLRQVALFGLVLNVDGSAVQFVQAGLKTISDQLNAIAKTANRTREVNPTDIKVVFERICLFWYAMAKMFYLLKQDEREVEEQESNDWRVISFHPHIPMYRDSKRSICLYTHVSDCEYSRIQEKMKTCSYQKVSPYLRHMAVYGFVFNGQKITAPLHRALLYSVAMENNFQQILRVIGKENFETYSFNAAYNIPNLREKVKDICHILRSMQFELH